MRNKYQTIPYSRQTITVQNIKEVNKVLKSDFITQGPVTKKFEDEISKFVHNFRILLHLIEKEEYFQD